MNTTEIRYRIVLNALAMAAFGTLVYSWIVFGGNNVNIGELVSIPFFAILFSWICFSFCMATTGFFAVLRAKPMSLEVDEATSSATKSSREDATEVDSPESRPLASDDARAATWGSEKSDPGSTTSDDTGIPGPVTSAAGDLGGVGSLGGFSASDELSNSVEPHGSDFVAGKDPVELEVDPLAAGHRSSHLDSSKHDDSKPLRPVETGRRTDGPVTNGDALAGKTLAESHLSNGSNGYHYPRESSASAEFRVDAAHGSVSDVAASETVGSQTSAVSSAQLGSRVAILMPVYNESPERVMAGVIAMADDIAESGDASAFDFYILSDTTKHDVWLREELTWSKLLEAQPKCNVYYRHRPRNTHRKAGNIADFCERWGANYDFMLVLDADSTMSGSTVHEMRARMDADPKIGILQVPPAPIGRVSLFARLQQFSAACYGPIFVRGFAEWSGADGNYWGHNAIIRIEPFLKHCDLPLLPGKAPLGGEILSHDFVEAALMLRNGWKVVLADDLSGSYEECPTTIVDYAQRDQRWCQGNLQHSRLLISENFHPLSRWNFASGIMSYSASPLWMLFTLFCILGTILDWRDARATISWFDEYRPQWISAALLFAASMFLLLAPKFLSAYAQSRSAARPERFGGRIRLWFSVLIETIASILLSPIMAIYHTQFVLLTLLGKKVKWNAQQRDERGVSWAEAGQQFSTHTVAGMILSLVLLQFAPTLLLWFSPLLAGLILSIPLAVAMGSSRVGESLRRMKLLLIPEEIQPPAVAIRLQEVLESQMLSTDSMTGERLFDELITNPHFFQLHKAIQQASEANVAMSTNQSKAIEAMVSSGGLKRIPVEVRSALLADESTLRALHAEAMMQRN